ncbi:MAG: hypothetical protein H6R14_805 [Proteobacteria bacterium]|nr:hypothetical protein [Pseudomonadota bacterium]
MSHTKEPWSYGEDNDGWYVEKDGVQIAHGLSEQDARRIVACVNACAGMDDPEGKLSEMRHMITDMHIRAINAEKNLDSYKDAAEYNKRRAEDAEKKRDDLLAALVNSRNCLESANEMGDGPIVDTIWYGPAETLFDYMDSVIFGFNGQPEKTLEIETTIPAIVFYPAGSLGEEVAP